MATTERRRKTQSGQEIFEFAMALVLLVPMFLGAFIVGMNLIRSIQCQQVCRDLTDMYIHGADFSTYSMQTMAARLSQGLNLQIGASFSGNSNSNNSSTGSGIVTVSQIMWVGATTDPNCAAAMAQGDTCTNTENFVFTQQIVFGNESLATSSTQSLGVPTGATLSSAGIVQNPVTDSHAKLPSASQTAMQTLWQQSNASGQKPLIDGQVVYIAETYFQSPDLSQVSSLSGSGVYARYFY
jgi:hypothetical protein